MGLFGRRKGDKKPKPETRPMHELLGVAEPQKVFKVPVVVHVYADDPIQAKDRLVHVLEHWHVEHARFPALTEITQSKGEL